MRIALVLVAAAALAAGPAAANGIQGVKVSRDGLWVRTLNGTGAYVAPPRHDNGANVVFSNIAVKYPLGLYFCCSGATVAGPDFVMAKLRGAGVGHCTVVETWLLHWTLLLSFCISPTLSITLATGPANTSPANPLARQEPDRSR